MKSLSYFSMHGTSTMEPLLGPPHALTAALAIVESAGPSIGLHLNRSKSLLFIPQNSILSNSPSLADIPVAHHGFSLLGSPIGPPSFCEEVFMKRISKLKASLQVLHLLEDSQLQTTLLRSCLSLPKVLFVLRSCPPNHIPAAIAEFDALIRSSLIGRNSWRSPV